MKFQRKPGLWRVDGEVAFLHPVSRDYIGSVYARTEDGRRYQATFVWKDPANASEDSPEAVAALNLLRERIAADEVPA